MLFLLRCWPQSPLSGVPVQQGQPGRGERLHQEPRGHQDTAGPEDSHHLVCRQLGRNPRALYGIQHGHGRKTLEIKRLGKSVAENTNDVEIWWWGCFWWCCWNKKPRKVDTLVQHSIKTVTLEKLIKWKVYRSTRVRGLKIQNAMVSWWPKYSKMSWKRLTAKFYKK